jgi:hypothetical protein
MYLVEMKRHTVIRPEGSDNFITCFGQLDRALDNFSTEEYVTSMPQCARARCIGLPFVEFGDRRKHFLTNFKYF